MVRWLLTLFLALPFLPPPGMCLCRCAAGHWWTEESASDDCAVPEGDNHHHSTPCDHPDHHAPGCPALRAMKDYGTVNPVKSVPVPELPGENPTPTDAAVLVHDLTAGPPTPAFAAPPLFLILRSFRI